MVPARAAVVRPASSAAAPTAPAPSTTSLARSSRNTIASAISSSVTATTSSTQRSISDSVSSPGRLTAIPSAMVRADWTATGFPSLSDSRTGAQLEAWTPITSIEARADFSAIATPLTSPPPPTGTITRARSSTCSSNSSPIVPCPAITSGSSNGCTNATRSS